MMQKGINHYKNKKLKSIYFESLLTQPAKIEVTR